MEDAPVSTTEIAQLQSRLARLERQNRRARMGGLLLILVAAASVALAQQTAPPPVPPQPPGPPSKARILEGTELRLMDASGRERLLITGGDFPIVSFLDLQGRTKMRIGLTPRGPTMGFYDERGKYLDLAGGFNVRPLTQ